MVQTTGCLDKNVVKITPNAHQMSTSPTTGTSEPKCCLNFTFYCIKLQTLRIGPSHGYLCPFVWISDLITSNHPPPPMTELNILIDNFAGLQVYTGRLRLV